MGRRSSWPQPRVDDGQYSWPLLAGLGEFEPLAVERSEVFVRGAAAHLHGTGGVTRGEATRAVALPA